MLSFFPQGVLDEILNLIESVSERFPSYSLSVIEKFTHFLACDHMGNRLMCTMFHKVVAFVECQFTPTQSYLHSKSRKENPQKPTQLSSRSHPRHLVGKRTAQKTPS